MLVVKWVLNEVHSQRSFGMQMRCDTLVSLSMQCLLSGYVVIVELNIFLIYSARGHGGENACMALLRLSLKFLFLTERKKSRIE